MASACTVAKKNLEYNSYITDITFLPNQIASMNLTYPIHS